MLVEKANEPEAIRELQKQEKAKTMVNNNNSTVNYKAKILVVEDNEFNMEVRLQQLKHSVVFHDYHGDQVFVILIMFLMVVSIAKMTYYCCRWSRLCFKMQGMRWILLGMDRNVLTSYSPQLVCALEHLSLEGNEQVMPLKFVDVDCTSKQFIL